MASSTSAHGETGLLAENEFYSHLSSSDDCLFVQYVLQQNSRGF